MSARIYGMPVMIVPERIFPRMKLDERVQVSDRFRVEMNAWLRRFFGTIDYTLVKHGEVLRVGDSLYMRHSTLNDISDRLGMKRDEDGFHE